ncbi:hypothetical protein P154DRAFT_552336 [Amniculicola lignicola CBS 123094]|uniref:Uncharacterized protein n=1 Tax=Amniculicola lignicola CBS 123094 TaxID=1392246 RepID=A0A6A5WSF6_9PLEO|nr:hypothetical protein P154DRAFT_552336 [Amniculicola lignicola CBS 123094]
MSASPHLSKSPQIQTLSRSPIIPQYEDPPDPRYSRPSPSNQHLDVDPPLFPPEDDEIPYPEPSSEQTLLPPPNFNPFFTIIEDGTTSEHHHPYVHYVFADDDPVIVTAAAMRSLGLDDTHYLPQNTAEGGPHSDPQREGDLGDADGDGDGEGEGEGEPQVESPLPPPIPGVKERYMIIDIAADGHTIVDAQSLASDWQITNARVRVAPSFNDESPEPGYMLRIQGVEVPRKNKGKSKGHPGENKLKEARDKAGGDIFGALDGLVKGVEGGLEVAGRIVGGREAIYSMH